MKRYAILLALFAVAHPAAAQQSAVIDSAVPYVRALTKPAVAQMLPRYFYLDGANRYRFGKPWMDSLLVRPPEDEEGIQRVASIVARMRNSVIDAYRPTTYAMFFDKRPIALPSYLQLSDVDRKRITRGKYSLGFDFAPADTLMAIVSTADITEAEALRRISTHKFDALIQHHSQSFYPVPLSRELLAANLAAAASNRPLDRLYAYANPAGLLHYTDLRTNMTQYRALFDTLRLHQKEILDYIAANVARYMPVGTQLQRDVSFFIVDWSDGWGADDVTAVDIEYYKGDVDRLINTLLHETFHAAQGAAPKRPGWKKAPLTTAADSMFDEAARQLLIEGTANFVAPTVKRSVASADSMARKGSQILQQLDALAAAPTYDRKAAQTIIDSGVSGGGPFYWLGAAMAKVIVEQLGEQALAETFREDGIGFLRTY